MITFAERLKGLMKLTNTTHEKLASSIGIATSVVSYYVKGTKKPKIETLIAIADYFNISLDYLVGRECSSNSPASKEIEEIAARLLEISIQLKESKEDN